MAGHGAPTLALIRGSHSHGHGTATEMQLCIAFDRLGGIGCRAMATVSRNAQSRACFPNMAPGVAHELVDNAQ